MAFVDQITKSKSLRTAGARAIAEFGNQTVAWGGLIFAKTLTPSAVDDFKGFVAKKVIRPRLNTSRAIFENTIPNFIADSKREQAGDDLDKQAELYASRLVDLTILFAFGWVGQLAGQRIGNKVAGVPEWGPNAGQKLGFWKGAKDTFLDKELNTMNLIDKAAQGATILTLNQGFSGSAKEWQNWVSGALQRNFDVDPIVADDRASLLVNTMLPSLIGATAGGVYQHHITKNLPWEHLMGK